MQRVWRNDVRASKSPMIIENCATLVILREEAYLHHCSLAKLTAGISGSPVKHSGKTGMGHTGLYLPFGWVSTTHASYEEEDAVVPLAKDRALDAEFSPGDVRSRSYVIDRIGNKSSLRLNSNVFGKVLSGGIQPASQLVARAGTGG